MKTLVCSLVAMGLWALMSADAIDSPAQAAKARSTSSSDYPGDIKWPIGVPQVSAVDADAIR